MTVRANEFQILNTIIAVVAIFVMNVQYFMLCITTPLTLLPFFFDQTQFERPFCNNLISWPVYFIVNPRSVYVCTSPATCFFMRARQDGFFANNTRCFLSTRDTVANHTAKNLSFISFNLARSTINRCFANNTMCVGFSFISLSHSSSIPHI